MTKRRDSLGFTAVEAILIVVIAALIGLVGYKVYDTKNSTDKIASDTEAVVQQTPASNSVPGTINSAGDLDQAQKALDELDAASSDDEDLSQLDSQLSAF
ncbi:hypothetical protein HY379_00200 [Candidatus Saccharibacteria bacterium]|nr:hypothetical protein [Candidatus Saccharibacteria bacterium]